MSIIGKNKIKNITPENKIEQQINSLNEISQSLQMSVAKEIYALNSQITLMCEEIGLFAYEIYVGEGLKTELLAERLDKITVIKTSINERNQKIEELKKRNEEEVGLLKNLMAQNSSENLTKDNDLKCFSCGKSHEKGALFCKECGNKLNASEQISAASDNILKCSSCEAPYEENTAFCKECGNKLN